MLRPYILIFALLAVSCDTDADNSQLKVVTTFTILADMARNVAGDAAEVVSLTKPGAEIHGYQPTPKDIVNARDADLVIYNGMNLELWFDKFLRRLEDVPRALATEGIEPIAIKAGSYAGKPNPHAWMSPSDALIYVDNIAAAMATADPKNANTYNSNAAAYKLEIQALVQPLKAAIETLPAQQRWLVTSEGAFSYLARDFKLKELYLWPMNADNQGTPQQVRTVIDTVRRENIGAIFSESTVSDKPAKQVARETGIAYGGVLYVDSLSEPDGPVPSYLDLIKVTSETVVTALTRKSP